MGRIVYLCGKSSCGKDTIFRELLQRKYLELHTIIPYTTRPVRDGEAEGKEYFFTSEEGFQKLYQAGRVIEHRGYHTAMGLWRYFTVDDGQIDLDHKNYLAIGTLESLQSMKNYYGQEQILPVFIELEDGLRLQRALDRERNSAHPAYQEMCRRYLADCQDFTEEKICGAGVSRRFVNVDLEKCLAEIEDYIKPLIC